MAVAPISAEADQQPCLYIQCSLFSGFQATCSGGGRPGGSLHQTEGLGARPAEGSTGGSPSFLSAKCGQLQCTPHASPCMQMACYTLPYAESGSKLVMLCMSGLALQLGEVYVAVNCVIATGWHTQWHPCPSATNLCCALSHRKASVCCRLARMICWRLHLCTFWQSLVWCPRQQPRNLRQKPKPICSTS